MKRNNNKNANQKRTRQLQERQARHNNPSTANDILVEFNAVGRMKGLTHSSGRRQVQGITIDDARARLLDDGIFMKPTDDGGWMIESSLVDVPALVPNHHPMELFARKHQQAYGADKPLFNYEFLTKCLNLKQGEKRPTVTFTFILDADLNLKSYSVDRTVFENLKQCNDNDIVRELAKGDPDVQRWMDLGHRLHEKRTKEMAQVCNNLAVNDNIQPTSAPHFPPHPGYEGTDLVHEIMRMTNLAAAEYFVDNKLPAPFKQAQGFFKVLHASTDFNFDLECNNIALDVIDTIVRTAPPYAKISSPMQKYRDFLGLKILTRHLDGKTLQVADAKDVERLTTTFNKATTKQDHTTQPGWHTIWVEHRAGQGASPHQAMERDLTTDIGALRKECKDRGWKMPKLAERLLLVNGVDIVMVALKCNEAEDGKKIAWAAHYDAATALNMAAKRMTRQIQPSPAPAPQGPKP
ncbi:RNB domain-containing ribonuclease [Micavibrio aeruginosavorus]|uniref:RNB domain-containing ribonuclease n=1 Tax=Micavibrio aeruginosavorus TaxID=349221 RepID=UPI003F4AAC1C